MRQLFVVLVVAIGLGLGGFALVTAQQDAKDPGLGGCGTPSASEVAMASPMVVATPMAMASPIDLTACATPGLGTPAP